MLSHGVSRPTETDVPTTRDRGTDLDCPECDQLVVGVVGANLAPGCLNPFLNLRQERIRAPAPVGGLGDRFARIASRDMPGDSVMRASGEFACCATYPPVWSPEPVERSGGDRYLGEA